MLKRNIYFKKNLEDFDCRFFYDKERTNEITSPIENDDLYILLQNGDILPLLQLAELCSNCKIFTPYLPSNNFIFRNIIPEVFTKGYIPNKYYTLNSGFDFILSKSYLRQEEPILLYLNKQDRKNISPLGFRDLTYDDLKQNGFEFNIDKPVYIVAEKGTTTNLNKMQAIAKELKQHYKIKKVGVFIRDCLVRNLYNYYLSSLDDYYNLTSEEAYNLKLLEEDFEMTLAAFTIEFEKDKQNHQQECFIDHIITTNSTGVLDINDKIRYPNDTNSKLTIMDCYDIMNCSYRDSIYKDVDYWGD